MADVKSKVSINSYSSFHLQQVYYRVNYPFTDLLVLQNLYELLGTYLLSRTSRRLFVIDSHS